MTGGNNSLTLNTAAGITNGGLSGGLGITGSLTLGTLSSDVTLANVIHDVTTAGSINKQGAGTLTLTSDSTYTGTTTVSAGTLLVTSSLGNTAVSVAAGASLGGANNATPGTGTVGGPVTVSGTLSAGATALSDVGTLTIGNLTFADGATYRADLNPGANSSDRVRASDVDFVTTAGAAITLDLRVTGALTSAAGQSLTLIENTGAVGTVSTSGRFTRVTNDGNTFATISTAANSFSFGGRTYALNYAGGDGNDVTLTDVTPAPPPDPGPSGPTSGDDNLTGTSGPDTISLGLGNDTFAGGAGNDLAYGNQGNDLIYGNQDADTLYGGQGDDRAFGGQGDDRLFGNLGNDVLYGNRGADIVYGNQGNDIVYGNQGADILFGGQGNDVLYGGQDNDTLAGGVGDDTLVGGHGADRYVFDTNSGRDLILGFNQAEGDRIALGGQTYTVSSAQNGDALLLLSGGGAVDLAGIRAEQVNASYFA